MSDGNPSRLNSAAILDAVLTLRACTVWQALSLLSQRPPSAVAAEFYERAIEHSMKLLLQRGLISAYRVPPNTKAHKAVNTRLLYKKIDNPLPSVLYLRPQQRELLARMRGGVEYEETYIVRSALAGYSDHAAARRVLKRMIEVGAITQRTLVPDGHMIVMMPTVQAWRHFGNHRPEDAEVGKYTPLRLPKATSIHHHLLTVDAALAIQRQVGLPICRFSVEEDLQADLLRGIDLRRARGYQVGMHPDAMMTIEQDEGTRVDVGIEVLSGNYSRERLIQKATLAEGTHFYAETPGVAERFHHITKKDATYLTADAAPHEWKGTSNTAYPLTENLRMAEREQRRKGALELPKCIR